MQRLPYEVLRKEYDTLTGEEWCYSIRFRTEDKARIRMQQDFRSVFLPYIRKDPEMFKAETNKDTISFLTPLIRYEWRLIAHDSNG